MASLAAPSPSGQSGWHWLTGSWTDRILLLLALVAIALSWQWIHARVSAGPPMARIYHGDKLLARYPLPPDAPVHLHVEGDIGPSEIVIDAKGARFVSSPCNGQQCVLSGYHKHAGDSAACVPNHILIAITGQRHDALDGISR
jgi:hypothetical protein